MVYSKTLSQNNASFFPLTDRSHPSSSSFNKMFLTFFNVFFIFPLNLSTPLSDNFMLDKQLSCFYSSVLQQASKNYVVSRKISDKHSVQVHVVWISKGAQESDNSLLSFPFLSKCNNPTIEFFRFWSVKCVKICVE